MARFPLTWRLAAIASIFSAISTGSEILRRMPSVSASAAPIHNHYTPTYINMHLGTTHPSGIESAGNVMLLCAGTRLGPYEILAPIGAGGMGEMYRSPRRQIRRPSRGDNRRIRSY